MLGGEPTAASSVAAHPTQQGVSIRFLAGVRHRKDLAATQAGPSPRCRVTPPSRGCGGTSTASGKGVTPCRVLEDDARRRHCHSKRRTRPGDRSLGHRLALHGGHHQEGTAQREADLAQQYASCKEAPGPADGGHVHGDSLRAMPTAEWAPDPCQRATKTNPSAMRKPHHLLWRSLPLLARRTLGAPSSMVAKTRCDPPRGAARQQRKWLEVSGQADVSTRGRATAGWALGKRVRAWEEQDAAGQPMTHPPQ